VVAEGNVRKGVARYTSGSNGSLVGCIDKNGNNQGASGILDSTSYYESSGTLDDAGAYNSSGIIDIDGTFHGYGTFDSWGAFVATGIIDADGNHYNLTYAHTTAGGTLTFPVGADVQADAGQFGIAGISEVPAYPTTAATIAADALLVAAQANFIVVGTDFTGGLGEVGNLAVVDVSDAGTGAAAGGELDLDDYVLITALPDAKYLYNAIDRGDGTTGTLRASTLHSGAGAPGVDLAANILKDGETVDDIEGEYVGSGGGGGAALSRVRLGM